MTTNSDTLRADTIDLAARHGLELVSDITFNETGLDFSIGFATDTDGQRWVLRIPRREDVLPKIEREARILNFVKHRLSVEVPDWQVCSPELVAYPLLQDPMALVFDAETGAISWTIDRDAEPYIVSLAEVLADLHASSIVEAEAVGIPIFSPEEARRNVFRDLKIVKEAIGVGQDLEDRIRRWLDNDRLWPDFSVLIHGDLYAGHVTAGTASRVTGVIDWTEARISDPSIDFSGHLAAFGLESLSSLIVAYREAGGRTWPTMREHVIERHAASPIEYGVFAIETGNRQHLAAAEAQLEVGPG